MGGFSLVRQRLAPIKRIVPTTLIRKIKMSNTPRPIVSAAFVYLTVVTGDSNQNPLPGDCARNGICLQLTSLKADNGDDRNLDSAHQRAHPRCDFNDESVFNYGLSR